MARAKAPGARYDLLASRFGIMFFDDSKTVRLMFRSEHEDPEKNAQMMKGISYSIDTQDTLHPADVAIPLGTPVARASQVA